MIITRTPFRISFFGGGTDYPAWFEKHGGAVLSTTIDKYTYISVRYLPPFFEHKHRIVYSNIENVNKIDDIRHPSVRECLRFVGLKEGIVINHDGDLPARSGMGSSSSFTVGLLNALHALKGEKANNIRLAIEAIYVEQDLIKENVGNQDQCAAAIGGLNVFEFHRSDKTMPVVPGSQTGFSFLRTPARDLEQYLMLAFTGFPRLASEIAGTYSFKAQDLNYLKEYVRLGKDILSTNTDIKDFGQLLDESWQVKKRLSGSISTPYIDYVYEKAINAGALGGKVLGAGGGGFILLFCEPDKQDAVRKALQGMLFVPFKFENKGTQIVLNNGGMND